MLASALSLVTTTIKLYRLIRSGHPLIAGANPSPRATSHINGKHPHIISTAKAGDRLLSDFLSDEQLVLDGGQNYWRGNRSRVNTRVSGAVPRGDWNVRSGFVRAG